MNETRKIVENTILEHERKYGGEYIRKVKVKCVAEFLDKIKNETKNLTIERYNIIGELNKIKQLSKGKTKFFKIFKIKILIKRRIYENVLDFF